MRLKMKIFVQFNLMQIIDEYQLNRKYQVILLGNNIGGTNEHAPRNRDKSNRCKREQNYYKQKEKDEKQIK